MLGVQGDNTARGEPFPINITLNYPLKQPEAKGAGPDPPRRPIRSDLSAKETGPDPLRRLIRGDLSQKPTPSKVTGATPPRLREGIRDSRTGNE